MNLRNKFLSLVGSISLTFGLFGGNQLDCSAMNGDHLKKAVLLGETEVGKTSISQRLAENKWGEHVPTVGCEFAFLKLGDSNQSCIQLWDTAGQEKYRSVAPMYMRDTDIAIFVFDLANEDTMQKLDDWISSFNNVNYHKKVYRVLVGNKFDLAEEEGKKLVSETAMREYAKSHDIDKFLSCSARTSYGIEELKGILCDFVEEANQNQPSNDEVVVSCKISENKNAEPQKKKCCK